MDRRLRVALILALAALLLAFLIAAMLMGPSGVAGPPLATDNVANPTGASPSGPSPKAASPATPSAPGPTPVSPTPTPPPAVIVGAGDIAECADEDDEATARLVEAIGGTVFLAGDNAYPDGSSRQYRECYRPSWGAFLDRTYPSPGNHEYQTRGAAGYLAYFGTRASPNGTTWYSWEAGAWHVIMLDSNCEFIDGCDAGSPQGRWLARDLIASEAGCTMAIWHHPRFSSGYHGNDPRTAPFWLLLNDAGVDVIVNGHDHNYERFAPQTPGGSPDAERGIREFVVGTGGADLRPFERIRANSEVRNARTLGVIRFELRADGYSWRFIPVPGRTFTDEGSDTCH